jgi:hypothetical protein
MKATQMGIDMAEARDRNSKMGIRQWQH